MVTPAVVEGDSDRKRGSSRWRMSLAGVALGLGYGLTSRLIFASDGPAPEWYPVMSLAFIFGVPLAIGVVSVWLAEIRTFRMALVFPWLPATLSLLAALLLLWEGWICIWLWLPLVLLLSALGGAVVWAVRRVGSPGKARSAVACVAALPLAASPLEQQLALPSQIRHVETEIRIEAPAERVWAAIVEVPAIAEREHEFAWSHAIGFPRPIAALADGEGVGSLRTATFERGVVFRERVHTWQPGVALAFSIDPESIPARGLDEHVTVGGKYFDVLSGSYRIERSQDGAVVLHLSSEHRLSTRFNAYASWWTDFIMRDTQRYILRIIRDRCEAAAE